MYDISLPTLDYTNKYSTKGNRPSSIIHIGYQLEITTNNTIEDNNLQAVIWSDWRILLPKMYWKRKFYEPNER